jgi:type III secretion protein J
MLPTRRITGTFRRGEVAFQARSGGRIDRAGGPERMTIWRLPTILLLAGLLAGCQSEVYRGLTQRDANAMLALLIRHGVEAKRESVDATTYRITVPPADIARSIELLRAAGLPRESYQSLGEVFRGDGLVVSPYEQRARMMFAQNQEMTRTISGIDGVIQARVHVVVPELDLRGQPQTKPTASIVVHYRPGVDTSELAGKIRSVVANGVQGLAYRDVALSFFTAQEFAAADPQAQSVPASMPSRTAAPGPQPGSRPNEAGPAAVESGPIHAVRQHLALAFWGLAGLSALAGLALLILTVIGPEATKRLTTRGRAPAKAKEA